MAYLPRLTFLLIVHCSPFQVGVKGFWPICRDEYRATPQTVLRQYRGFKDPGRPRVPMGTRVDPRRVYEIIGLAILGSGDFSGFRLAFRLEAGACDGQVRFVRSAPARDQFVDIVGMGWIAKMMDRVLGFGNGLQIMG